MASKRSPQRDRAAAPAAPRLDGSEASEKPSGSDALAAGSGAARKPRPDPQAWIASVFGQCLLSKGPEARAPESPGSAGQTDPANPRADGGKQKSPAEELSRPFQAGLKEAGKQPCQLEQHGKPHPRTPNPPAALKPSPPTNGLRTGRPTKPTTCFTLRRKVPWYRGSCQGRREGSSA